MMTAGEASWTDYVLEGRVWFNRMHPSVDPERGLRIDFTDRNNPILTGTIGAQTRAGSAMIDDVIVLPPKAE